MRKKHNENQREKLGRQHHTATIPMTARHIQEQQKSPRTYNRKHTNKQTKDKIQIYLGKRTQNPDKSGERIGEGKKTRKGKKEMRRERWKMGKPPTPSRGGSCRTSERV